MVRAALVVAKSAVAEWARLFVSVPLVTVVRADGSPRSRHFGTTSFDDSAS